MGKTNLMILAIFLLGISTLVPLPASADSGAESTATRGWAVDPPVILESGGPDAYGYYYIDSEDMAYNAPVFNWIDISSYGVNMNITGDDQNVGPFATGFTLNFYGIDFISFRACSNGWVSFSSAGSWLSNTQIPNPNDPNDLLAILWDDLHPRETGQAYYWTNNVDTLIIAYYDFQRYSGDGSYTFEMILTADGNILYQYLSVSGVLNSHTVGIENSSGTVGLQYAFNEEKIASGKAVLFTLTPPDYGAQNVLLIAADDASQLYAELSVYPDIGDIGYYDGRLGTPALWELQQYDCVIVWSDYQFFDRVAMGNVLADYLESGGGVVLGQFCFGSGWHLDGRIMTEYSPFAAGTIDYGMKNMGDCYAGHQLMYGVGSAGDTFASLVTLQNSPILVASYDDGTPFVAYNPENNLVAINSYPGDNRQFTGDMARIFHNAAIFSTEGPPEILFIEGGTGCSIAAADLKAFGDINSIHHFNVRYGAPTLAMLENYQAVVIWTDYQPGEPQVMGNRLADYIDMGGGVLLMMASFANDWDIQGRLVDSYSPFGPGDMPYTTRSLGWYDADHPLMADVSSVTEIFYAEVTMENDGVSVASWDDSTPFVAYNPDHAVVAVNGFIGDPRQCTGDMMTVVHNSINYLRGQTAVDDDGADLPVKFALSQNYPNPFNPATIIEFSLPGDSDVNLQVFNVLGQRVAVLAQGKLQAGYHTIRFDGSNLASGVYFYRLDAGDFNQTRKMMIMK